MPLRCAWRTRPSAGCSLRRAFSTSSIAYCCVMYDFVLVDATDLEVPPELVDVIVPVRPYEASGIEPRWKIAAARYGEIARTSALRSEIDDTWTRMLGRKVAVDFLSFDSVTDSPGIRQYTPGGPFGFYDPIGSMSRQRNEDFSRDVSIQTFRYLINEKVAESLGVSYHCTSLRFPSRVPGAQQSIRISLCRRGASRSGLSQRGAGCCSPRSEPGRSTVSSFRTPLLSCSRVPGVERRSGRRRCV